MATSVTPAQNFQPLPHRETARPLAEFAPRFKAAAQGFEPAADTAAPGAHEAAPLPAAPVFARQVARGPQNPATRATPPTAAPTARPAEERGAVPERLAGLLQAARGRAAMAAGNLGANEAATGLRPTPRSAAALPTERATQQNPARPLPPAAPLPAPREAPVALNTLARPATEPAAGAAARTRLPLANINQEIQQLNARQTLETAVRDRTIKEAGGTGMPRTPRTILDARA